MNRLIAEKNNPQADVYWANEPIRAEVLRQQGIAAPYVSPNAHGIPASFKDPNGYWTGFAARARVLIVNKKHRRKARFRACLCRLRNGAAKLSSQIPCSVRQRRRSRRSSSFGAMSVRRPS